MKNHAFTLIELLVVVLIIGILAAIALPQYQTAVEKAKAMQAIVSGRALLTAGRSYRLANGKWPTTLEDFTDIEVSHCSSWVNQAGQTTEVMVLVCYGGTRPYFNAYLHQSNGKEDIYCRALSTDALGQRVCKSLSGLTAATMTMNGGEGELALLFALN